MQYDLKTEQPLTDAASKAATGKTLKQWFAELEAQDALKLGRRKTTWWLMESGGFKDDWWRTTIAVEFERHAGQLKKDGLYEGYGICATKTIAAPVEAVYSAWANETDLAKWFGTGTKAQVADGGSYSNQDGDQGKYLRVRLNKDLRFTFENSLFSAPTQVDVTFEDKGKGKTLVMANHSRIQTRAEADGLRAAWGSALEKLKTLLEK